MGGSKVPPISFLSSIQNHLTKGVFEYGKITYLILYEMICYFKILNLSANSKDLERNPYLIDKWKIESQNDEIIKQETEHFGLTFSIKNQHIRLHGSLHKYFNRGEHNYNDFRGSDVAEVVNELSERFEIEAQNSLLNNIEIGVNIVLPFETKILLNSLIAHKNKPFSREVEEGKVFYKCERTHFKIKIYDKGLQNRLAVNLLRFELHVKKMQFLQTKNIKLIYLSDLLELGLYQHLGQLLHSCFDEILFDDLTIKPCELNPTDKEIYLIGSNTKTWIQEKRTDQQQKELERLKVKFLKILDENRKGENLPQITSDLIRLKCIELSEIYQDLPMKTDFDLSEIYRLSEEKEEEEKTDDKTHNVGNLHFRYNIDFRQLISEQKRGSRFISEKTLKNNFEVCEILKSKRRQNKRKEKTKSEEYYVAHDERNDESNFRNNLAKKLRKELPKLKHTLFGDVRHLLKLTEKQRQALEFWKGTEYDLLNELSH